MGGSTTILESQQNISENTPMMDGGNDPLLDHSVSTKASKGSTSFLNAFGPWSTRSPAISDSTMYPSSDEGKTCATLVEEVFHPQQAQTSEKTEETSFLPTLLSRVNFSMWSQTSSKNLSGEIKLLQGQQGAAAKLLEEVEREADNISIQLKEKTQQVKVARFQGNTGLFGIACGSCGPVLGADEINVKAVRVLGDDTLELRPMLRIRIKECEQEIVERDVELRQLRHEIQLLRGEKEMIRQDEKDAVLDGPANAKETLLRRYAAAFCVADGTDLKVALLAWKQHVKQRAIRTRILKHSSLGLAGQSSQLKALLFASWQTLVRDKQEAQKLKQERQRLTIGQSYAAKFAMQTDSSTMRAIFIGWWRVSKESALRSHVAAAQAQQDASTPKTPLALTQKQGATTDKACCILM